MLPETVTFLDCSLMSSNLLVFFCLRTLVDLRVDVVLEDPGRQNPYYIEQWHMFLPSDMLLGI